MRLHEIHATQRLPITMDEAWTFFSSPANLRHITPPWLDFRITNTVPEVIHPGSIITYTVRPLRGVRVRWVTEITHVDPPKMFVDEQRFGPYRFWHHQHHFRPVEGGVEVVDRVHFALPIDAPGEPIYRLLVRPRVEAIFSFRRDALERRFAGGGAAESPITPAPDRNPSPSG